MAHKKKTHLSAYTHTCYKSYNYCLGSCVDAGFDDCCNPYGEVSCSVQSGGFSSCYCDQACYQRNDCCFDIAEICPCKSFIHSCVFIIQYVSS